MNAPLPFPEPIRLTPELRRKLEHAVDQILALLDATAPDPDAEPSLGFLSVTDQRHSAAGTADDCEEEHDGSEPELGWTETINQAGRSWAGGLDDAEEEHDGGEPDADREPWLGWSVSGAQGDCSDLELEEGCP